MSKILRELLKDPKDTKEVAVKEQTNLATYGGILDFKKMFDSAMDLFSEQALGAKNSKSIRQLELTKAKVNSFNNSIDNITALSHTLEIMGADKDRFRRQDELNILNNLRTQCELQSRIGLANMAMVQDKLKIILESDNPDVEEIASLQGVLDANIDSSNKVIAAVSRLIQLERYSGNRPWGRNPSNNQNIGYIKLDEEDEDARGGATKGKRAPTRKITHEDLAQAKSSSISYED